MTWYSSSLLQSSTTKALGSTGIADINTISSTSKAQAQSQVAYGSTKSGGLSTSALVLQSLKLVGSGFLVTLVYAYNIARYYTALLIASASAWNAGNYLDQPTAFSFLFGKNATQDAASITIKKSDFPSLNANAHNTASSLLVMLLLNAGNGTAHDADGSINVRYWGQRFYEEKVIFTYEQLFYDIAQYDGNILLDINMRTTVTPNDY